MTLLCPWVSQADSLIRSCSWALPIISKPQLSDTGCLNDRCSSYLHNNVGVPQEVVLSPFLFSLHTDPLSTCHSRLLKYADCFVFINFYTKCSDQEDLDDDLYRRATWSADHWLLINKTKCAKCLFYSTNIFSHHQLFFINGEAVSREQTVKYLGEYITSIMTWCTHMNTVFTNCLRLSFFNRRLRTMNAQWCFHGELFQSVLSL